jgi:uncharacterized membrane protein YphA (DoxX/SURF4 family)
MNQYLRRCVEDFERVSTEIGFLPALLWATLIIIMTVVGFGVGLILGALVLALSPLVLVVVLGALWSSRSDRAMVVRAKQAPDPWLSE